MTKLAPKLKKTLSRLTKDTLALGRLKAWGIPLGTLGLVLLLLGVSLMQKKNTATPATAPVEVTPVISNPNIIPLPSPSYRSSNSIESVLRLNQARRAFRPDMLSLNQLGQVLWSGQGVVTDWGGRTVTSAKSTFPLTLYVLANNIDKLEKGIYQYIPGDRLPAHQLIPIKAGDFLESIFAVVNQTSLKNPPAVVVLTGNLGKMASAYGDVPHDKEVYLEAGSVIQNMYLEVESQKLGMISITNFDESQIRLLLSLPQEETIVSLIPLGFIKE